jgi:hypothetical protein
VLVLVPVALARPAFTAAWLLPAAFWLDGSTWSDGHAVRIVPVLVLAAAAFVLPLREDGRLRGYVRLTVFSPRASQ